MDYLWIIVMFLSAVWTLILTAPIHCRASIAETLMQRHISTNLMKKQTHPNLEWTEGECISSTFWVNYSRIQSLFKMKMKLNLKFHLLTSPG